MQNPFLEKTCHPKMRKNGRSDNQVVDVLGSCLLVKETGSDARVDKINTSCHQRASYATLQCVPWSKQVAAMGSGSAGTI